MGCENVTAHSLNCSIPIIVHTVSVMACVVRGLYVTGIFEVTNGFCNIFTHILQCYAPVILSGFGRFIVPTLLIATFRRNWCWFRQVATLYRRLDRGPVLRCPTLCHVVLRCCQTTASCPSCQFGAYEPSDMWHQIEIGSQSPSAQHAEKETGVFTTCDIVDNVRYGTHNVSYSFKIQVR